MGEIESFRDNLNRILHEKFGGNVAKFARTAGVPVSTLRGYIVGRTVSAPDVGLLSKLSKAAEIRPDMLYAGFEGHYFDRDDLFLSKAEARGDRVVCDHLDVYNLSDIQMFLDNKTPEPIGMVCVPVTLVRPSYIYARVVGSCMYPVICNNALVCIDRKGTTIASGDMYAIRDVVEGVIIRKLYASGTNIILSAMSAAVPSLTIPYQDVRVVGKVVFVIQRLQK